jgi:hypothetical protein
MNVKPAYEAFELAARTLGRSEDVTLVLFICQSCGTAGTGSFTSWHVCPSDPREHLREPGPDVAALAGGVVRRWKSLDKQEYSQLRKDYRALDNALVRLALNLEQP